MARGAHSRTVRASMGDRPPVPAYRQPKGESMADIYCPKCAEPWDIYSLHDVPGLTFDEARAKFTREGCETFDSKCTGDDELTEADRLKAMAASAVMDLSPHPDDWAADMADFDLFL